MISVNIRKDFGSSHVAEDVQASDARGEFTLLAKFEAPQGITILFGASGSGKTTTLKSIAGIMRPDSGSISINGQTLFDSERGINKPIRERGVGLVFQNLALFPHMSAQRNVEFAISGLSRAARRERALELMERLHISHTASRYPTGISGGEAQRVALARALASKPRVLLLDEPLSAVDEATKQGIIADLKMINHDLHVPVIYVTHSRDEAVMLGDYLIAYDCGHIVATGEPLEIFSSPVIASVARLSGVENIFEGIVLHRNDAAGTMTINVSDQSGTCRLDTPLGKESPGEGVLIAVRSGDILLATEELRATSARNILRGRINAIEERSGQTIVRIESGVTWAASVTRQAVNELKLSTGQTIWLAIKTHSCYLLDARKE